ncbi:hypothetical protein KIW84_046120 [Lathyrus oleraceus]|uniref:Uncharacterized protein n=1 Tax=Pisum sativum TaxID=3888 RepID=A0A9D5ASQ6_PEA|nr:hypothetical protein KIW84_046120 [Pisum sativum]
MIKNPLSACYRAWIPRIVATTHIEMIKNHVALSASNAGKEDKVSMLFVEWYRICDLPAALPTSSCSCISEGCLMGIIRHIAFSVG